MLMCYLCPECLIGLARINSPYACTNVGFRHNQSRGESLVSLLKRSCTYAFFFFSVKHAPPSTRRYVSKFKWWCLYYMTSRICVAAKLARLVFFILNVMWTCEFWKGCVSLIEKREKQINAQTIKLKILRSDYATSDVYWETGANKNQRIESSRLSNTFYLMKEINL